MKNHKFKIGDKVITTLGHVGTIINIKDNKYEVFFKTDSALISPKRLKLYNNMKTETHKGYCTTDVETTNESKKVAWFSFYDNNFADKVELDLSNRELIQEDGKWFVVKKKKSYPNTYEECYHITGLSKTSDIYNYKNGLLFNFQKLLIARDAYWKIAGEEMGLNEPWKPDYDSGVNKYGIICLNGVVQESNPTTNWERHLNKVLDFPTAEMRDAFKEYFDSDLEICKEFL